MTCGGVAPSKNPREVDYLESTVVSNMGRTKMDGSAVLSLPKCRDYTVIQPTFWPPRWVLRSLSDFRSERVAGRGRI